jgi:glyoxylase-like metal-dependent hydrolase (beta-lactamase superfamily II)
MGRILAGLLTVLVAIGGAGAVYVYSRIQGLDVEQVTPDVHMLFGLGGNVAVLRTDAGAVVVDTMRFRMQGERIRELAERLGGGPVQMVLNTHYHADHTHGNPGFAPGTRVVSTIRTREHLLARDADFWSGAARQALPSSTFRESHEMRIGGKTIRALHPGRGHTDGDLVALFVEDRVLVAGDLLFHGRYPRTDLAAGGSVRNWVATLEKLEQLEFDHVIPGHGRVTDRAGLRAFRTFLRELWEVGSQAAAEGKSLEETLAGAQLTTDQEFEVFSIPFVRRIDRDSALREVWEEASRAAPGAPTSAGPRSGGGGS